MRLKRHSTALVGICLCVVLMAPFLVTGEAAEERHPVEVADILAWRSQWMSALSDDGRWFAYQLSSRQEYHEIVVRQTRGEKEYRFPVDAFGPVFSSDSRRMAFGIRPKLAEEGEPIARDKKTYNRAGLVDLLTGEMTEFPKVMRFAFSEKNPEWLAFHHYPTEDSGKNGSAAKGSDLILFDLSSLDRLNIGNVSEFAFDPEGQWLAWTIDSRDIRANGVQLMDMTSGKVSSLDHGEASYRMLAWTENGDGLTVLKEREEEDYENKLCSVLGFKGLSSGSPEKIIYDPIGDEDFPKGMTISPNKIPRWTEDLTGLIFGIHDAKEKAEKEDSFKKDDIPDLILWHWRDQRPQPRQRVEEERDIKFSYLCVYWIGEKKFVRLADDTVKEVTACPHDRWAVGLDESPYLYMSTLDGREYNDIYVIDMKTGKSRLVVEKCREFMRPRWFFTPSPDGSHFLYYDNRDAHFYTCEMDTRKIFNVTKDLPTSFVNEDVSYNQLNPAIRPFGWSKDSRFVLLSDNWDVWKVSRHGEQGINLTINGKKDGIRYKRKYVLDFTRSYQQLPEVEGIDLSGPVYFEAYGEWTKKEGIALIDKGVAPVKMLLWEDAIFWRLFKAEKSDELIYLRETFNDHSYFLTDASFRQSKRLLGPSPQQENVLWSSGSMLIDYKSQKGERLQAALFLPANYEQGKSYPTIVYIYEKRSNQLNRYFYPFFASMNKTVYTSRGYAVLMPDIVYELNNPGMSAVWCVLPAVEAAVATGVVDKDRIGLIGHSWGGYQTAFLVTQTDLFKAAVPSAPLTNMISVYNTIYGSTGDQNSRWFESSQDRFKGGYWGEYFDDYIRNSPVMHADKVKTPLLILHSDKDGAVDFNQGVEYFTSLRRLQNPVIMLQYEGEGHSLRKFANQMDCSIRVQEFFDHHLMGKPAPRWMEEGIPYLNREKRIKEELERYYPKIRDK